MVALGRDDARPPLGVGVLNVNNDSAGLDDLIFVSRLRAPLSPPASIACLAFRTSSDHLSFFHLTEVTTGSAAAPTGKLDASLS
jgi:hypothetical protein